MTEYNFSYKGTEIKYTVDMLGNEKVYVDNQLLAKDRKWFKSVNKFEFSVNEEQLSITSYMASYEDGEVQVTLASQTRIIEKQTKMVIDLSSDGKETVYEGNEYEWLNEIKLPKSVFHFAWVVYFSLIFQSFTASIFDSPMVSSAFAWLSISIVVLAIVLFFAWGFKEVFRNTQKMIDEQPQ